MFQNHIHQKDLPLLTRDLALMQRVFDAVRADAGATAGDQYSDLIASTLVHLYKQGVREEAPLLEMLRQSAPRAWARGWTSSAQSPTANRQSRKHKGEVL